LTGQHELKGRQLPIASNMQEARTEISTSKSTAQSAHQVISTPEREVTGLLLVLVVLAVTVATEGVGRTSVTVATPLASV
jgi:Mrp family chromosome partitioning ATPase